MIIETHARAGGNRPIHISVTLISSDFDHRSGARDGWISAMIQTLAVRRMSFHSVGLEVSLPSQRV